ncbi:fibronectin type III domain-containing protein [Flagellimonas sp. S3867]|uniref:fibronectin type III domain-containing protein n=1 Tax=Flagellimonas sp. S3867 TaxID=2768063 RepID=UPI001687EE99|nr:fibronectin type III domain-containing protein [Flagellimonas sp. S3867]
MTSTKFQSLSEWLSILNIIKKHFELTGINNTFSRVLLVTMFFVCATVISQTNLVPSSARIPELKAWIDAEEQTGADGSLITTITDQAQVITGITVEGSIMLNVRSDGKKEFSFAGSNNAINLGQPTVLDFTPGTDEFTIMGLLGTGVPSQGVFVCKGISGGSWQYGIDVTQNKFWTSIGNPSDKYFIQSDGLVNENIHFTLVVKQNESSLYLDGQHIETRGSGSIGTTTQDVDVLIGSRRANADNTGFGYEYSDHLRNVGLFSKALSTSEIQAIYTDLTNPSSDTQAPTTPALTSAGQTDTTADLSWNGATDNVGVTGYKIFKDGNLEATLGNVNAYQVTGLTASTAYSFTVTALDAAGNESSASNAVSITTDASSGGGSGGSVWSESNSVASYSGDVAIGTSAVPAGYKMAIDGKLITEEVKVQLSGNWPDYVFKEDYDLPTLEEIQKHIEEKGHLPNIPSAKEIEVNGIELGAMNKLLLEKIEELTLYILQQSEMNKSLVEEIAIIKKTINEKP